MSSWFGHELRLFIGGELFQSQVCRSTEAVVNTYESWTSAMLEKGWA